MAPRGREKRSRSSKRMMGTFLSSAVLVNLFLCIADSQNLDSFVHSHYMPRDSSGLEKRQAQYIINPCPEFFAGNLPQYCSQAACGGDQNERGICDKIRLNGLQERRCQFDGGCGTYCRCRPDEYANGPSVTIQYIGIFCPESYGLPLQKCSEPSCGGDAYYEGICSNILVSGAQGRGCPPGGCGIFCRCDPSPGPDPPSPTATTITIIGSDQPIVQTSDAGMPSQYVPPDTTEIIQTIPGPSYTPVSSESDNSDMTSVDLIYTSGPLPEPTAFPIPIFTALPPVSTSGSGGGVPIIPIIPFPPPPAGFIPPPPGTPNPSEETCPNYQDNECSECGGEYGWCQQPPNQGCPCQEACTEGEYTPDCNDEQCEGNEDNQCTIGSQKDCNCKPGCPEGDEIPLCTIDTCQGGSDEQCTEGDLAGCDCFNAPTVIADYGSLAWMSEQQVLLAMLSAHDPGWMYTTVSGYSTGNATSSQQPTTTSLATTSANVASTTAVSSTTTCWTVRSYTICIKPEKVLTTSDGHLVSEALIETFTEYPSSAAPITSNTAIISTATSAIAASLVPAPTPSQAMIIYRRDVCEVTKGSSECSSWALEYDITPGQGVDTCEETAGYQAPNYTQKLPQYEKGVTSNYQINVGPFNPHSWRDCSYSGTYDAVGKLTCVLWQAPCIVPLAPVQTCGVATDTPIVYAEW